MRGSDILWHPVKTMSDYIDGSLLVYFRQRIVEPFQSCVDLKHVKT